jgi:hypothetical protein
MRIVNRAEFLALPGQVLYSKVHKGSPEEGVFIKYPHSEGQNHNDWNYDAISGTGAMECGGSDELWDNIFAMVKNPAMSVPTDFHYTGRDGHYDGDEVQFLIFEKEDIVKLNNRFTELLENMA